MNTKIILSVFVLTFLLSSVVGIQFNVPLRATTTSIGMVDLFTQRNGKGPNQPSGSFRPQEMAILYAYVTYNNKPVQNKFVSFEVLDPLNRSVMCRTAETNTSGLTTVWFSIPEHSVIGMWFAIAKTKVAEEIVEDTLTFIVSVLGDVNGDGKVRSNDIILVGLALFTEPGDPKWNLNADVNGDGRIRSNDIIVLGKHLFEEC